MGSSNPFNNPHPDPALVDLFRRVRRDARADPKPTQLADLACIEWNFDGGASALAAGLSGTLEVPFDCRLMGARIFLGRADTASSAAVDVRHGSYADYPIVSPLYDTIPTLTSALKADLTITSWTRRLLRRDVLTFDLLTFTGAAKRLTISLWVRKLNGPSGSSTVTDSTSDTITDSSGATVTLRS